MARITRRQWHAIALSTVVAGPAAVLRAQRGRKPSRYRRVLIGAQSYSFRDRDLDGLIKGMVDLGLTSCELWQGHVEPGDRQGPAARDAIRQWRLTVPLDHFRAIRARFDAAHIDLSAYNLSFRDDFSDEEIDRGFLMARALGVPAITASAQMNTVPRIARMAARHGVPVAMHNHSRVDANEFSSPRDFARAMAQGDGRSLAVNLDIGHFIAAGHDPVAYLRAHHDQIVTIHLKDRRRQQGPNVPWGEGDTPIREVLRVLRDERWAIPANIEYEYRGGDTLVEMRRCLDYCRAALDG